MKKSDLYREYARALDMCENTEVREIDCIRWCEKPVLESGQFHNWPLEKYSFALAIVEDKPVFEGDKMWCILGEPREVTIKELCNGTHLVATDGGIFALSNIEKCLSWNQPKPETITVTIPRPKSVGPTVNSEYAEISFDDYGYRNMFVTAIREAMK